MSEPTIIEYTVQALILVLMLSLPPILVAALSGIIVSLIQAVTQVQEQTISFAVKLVAVIVTILLTARWIGGELYNFSLRLFENFPTLVQ
jgi:type III secretion protein S